jgi:hypothetical protein
MSQIPKEEISPMENELTLADWQEVNDHLLRACNPRPVLKELARMSAAIDEDSKLRDISYAEHPIFIMLVNQLYQLTNFSAGAADACDEIQRMAEGGKIAGKKTPIIPPTDVTVGEKHFSVSFIHTDGIGYVAYVCPDGSNTDSDLLEMVNHQYSKEEAAELTCEALHGICLMISCALHACNIEYEMSEVAKEIEGLTLEHKNMLAPMWAID